MSDASSPPRRRAASTGRPHQVMVAFTDEEMAAVAEAAAAAGHRVTGYTAESALAAADAGRTQAGAEPRPLSVRLVAHQLMSAWTALARTEGTLKALAASLAESGEPADGAAEVIESCGRAIDEVDAVMVRVRQLLR